MAELIKTITDKNLFEKIFYKFFLQKKVYLRTKNGDLKIEFFGYTDGMAALRIPYIKNMYDNCLIFTRNESYTIYANLKLVEKQEDDSYIFIPIKFQIISAMRREDRRIVDIGGQGKNIIYVTSVISDFIIQNSLAMESKKVDHVKEIVRFDLEKQFKQVRIFFCNEGMTDLRMKYFYDIKPPYLISDINNKNGVKDQAFFNYYLNNIYGKDYQLINRKNIISEVSVPVLYKARIPYGYIQCNGAEPLSESALLIVKRMAIVVEELFNKYKVFPVSDERLLVSDVSKNGVGIVFKERRFIRYFKENSYVYFDLNLPANKKASCFAVIRNIGILENKIIKVGCELRELDALSEVNYDEYLESIGLS
ncbi:MAG TPA: hypothetical protein PKO25_12800 [Spirochaetota bacterium]|nr:hypothetical protein [Spirochaetota bacterium]HNU92743.1 hypothetical protein [Spirochaetota bacterium]HPV99035.1 hypothetical protein [Spirochaetota bacterium]